MESIQGNPLYISIGAVAVVAVAGYHVLFRKNVDVNRLPPAPKMGLLPFLKQLLGFQGPQFALDVAREIGYIYRTPGLTTPCWMVVSEPTLARQILENPLSLKPFQAYELFDKATGGETFFPVNGPRANHVRKSTAAAFSPQAVKHMAKIVEEVLENWIQNRLEPLYVKVNKPLDMDEEMILVTTDVIALAAFDYKLSEEERRDFATKMRQVMTIFFHQGLNPLRKFFGACFSDIREARKTAQELTNDYGYRFLKACRDNPEPNPNSVISLMLQDKEYENDDQRARDIMLYFFGGFETTAHSIAWTMLELARHSEEQTKLRSALYDFVAANGNEDIKACPELKHVTREVLRLHTPAALGPCRVADKDIPIPDTDWYIPKVSGHVSRHFFYFMPTKLRIVSGAAILSCSLPSFLCL